MSQIELSEQNAQPVLMIRTRTSMETLSNVIGEGYEKIVSYLAGIGQQPAGVPYTCYHNTDMQDMDVEIGFPVAKMLPGKGDIQAGELPAGKYVTMMYKGPYSGMEKPYDEIFAWMKARGYGQAGVYYEYYYNAPDEVPEEELLTKIAIPVK
jgi:effector-binding domain-containing protein